MKYDAYCLLYTQLLFSTIFVGYNHVLWEAGPLRSSRWLHFQWVPGSAEPHPVPMVSHFGVEQHWTIFLGKKPNQVTKGISYLRIGFPPKWFLLELLRPLISSTPKIRTQCATIREKTSPQKWPLSGLVNHVSFASICLCSSSRSPLQIIVGMYLSVI